MASIKAQRALAPAFMKPDGNSRFLHDKVALAANPGVGDTLDFLIPAGSQVCTVAIKSDDLDTNGAPAIVYSAGYRPVNGGSGLAANATYFAAAGQTSLQSGGRNELNFKPITFEEDVYLQLTIGTAAATFAAGEVHAIVGVNCVGVR